MNNNAYLLFILTLIQLWWIAIWGLAYIVIGYIAGKSKMIEIFIYIIMLVVTIFIINLNPQLLQRL